MLSSASAGNLCVLYAKMDRLVAWRPPVFKNKADNLATRTLLHAFSFAVSIITVITVNDVLDHTIETVNGDMVPTLNPHLRRFLAFLSAMLSGGASYLFLVFLFGAK